MNFKQKAIKDIFTKLGKETFKIWFSGKEREGEYKTWYDTGRIIEHSFWKNGKLDGEFKEWYSNGQIHGHSFWKKGRLEGERMVWDTNGQIIKHSFWKNSRKVREIK